MKNMIEQLTDGIDKGIVNGIIEKAGKLNRNGQDELKAGLIWASPKIKKLAKAQRPAKINSIIDELLKTGMEEKAMTQEEKELFEKFKEYMYDHLIIEVEGEYDPCSGQSEHYHRVTFYFK